MLINEYAEQARAWDKEALFKTFDRFAVKVLNGDIAALELVSEDIIGIGLGEQGYYTGKSEMKNILENVSKMPAGDRPEVTVEYGSFDVRIFSQNSATINAEAYVITEMGGHTTKSGIMQMAGAHKENGKWLFNLLCATPLALTEESIESYPLAFADEALKKLKGELQTETFEMMNESFSGGILGTYVKENYPLYFANDAFIEMFGYERAEFEEKFKNNTVQIVYTDDKEHMREISEYGETLRAEKFGTRARWTKKDGSPIWIEFRTRKSKDDYGNDIFLSVVMDVTEIVNLRLKAEGQNQTIMESINYASKIQRNLLPPDEAMASVFSDYSVIWAPRDIVGGDIYWMKQFDRGTVLCVCDCTGHGTPGALLTMLVTSALEAITSLSNCNDTADIVWRLDQRLSGVLHVGAGAGARQRIMDIYDGCDLVAVFIANDGSVTFSSGKIPVFVCNGNEVTQYKGQKIFVGEGKLNNKDEVVIHNIPADPDNKFYIASDGLFDQIGDFTHKQFGYNAFKQIILDNHYEKQAVITGRVWDAFEEFRGEQPRRDDFELITFKPNCREEIKL